MPEISFSPDDSLYRDRDKLSQDYTPEEIVVRDDEIQRNQGYPAGEYNAYELGHDAEMILAAMSDLLNEVGVHQSVVDIVEESDRISVSV